MAISIRYCKPGEYENANGYVHLAGEPPAKRSNSGLTALPQRLALEVLRFSALPTSASGVCSALHAVSQQPSIRAQANQTLIKLQNTEFKHFRTRYRPPADRNADLSDNGRRYFRELDQEISSCFEFFPKRKWKIFNVSRAIAAPLQEPTLPQLREKKAALLRLIRERGVPREPTSAHFLTLRLRFPRLVKAIEFLCKAAIVLLALSAIAVGIAAIVIFPPKLIFVALVYFLLVAPSCFIGYKGLSNLFSLCWRFEQRVESVRTMEKLWKKYRPIFTKLRSARDRIKIRNDAPLNAWINQRPFWIRPIARGCSGLIRRFLSPNP